MPELFEPVPERVLAVYAHPDDPEVSCGATLARWAQAGSEVHVLVCTKGEKGSSDATVDRKALARRRAKEVKAAAEVLGLAGHEQLTYGDGELENTAELRRRIVTSIRKVRADLVICPDPTAVFFGDSYFNHRDHRQAGWATLDAVSPAAGSPHYFPDAGPAHPVTTVFLSGTLEPNVWVDVSDSLEPKIEALLCHDSQLQSPVFGHDEAGGMEWFADVIRQRAEESGRVAGVRWAEGFRRLTFG